MAKIKFGMMMTDARGKLGGQVFSKNRAGAYIRTKVTPSNPQTPYQSLYRSALAALSSNWNSLTPAQIAQWNSSVDDWTSTDVFGDIKKPTGKNLYVKLNLNLTKSAQAGISVPPSKIELPQLLEVQATVSTSLGTIVIDGLPIFSSGRYVIEACAPVPRGVNFVKNKFRIISVANITTASSPDVSAAYILRFGSFENAENIFFRISAIGENGQSGVPYIVKATFS